MGNGPTGEWGLWSWWAMVGLYFHLVGNCPRAWGVVLEPVATTTCKKLCHEPVCRLR